MPAALNHGATNVIVHPRESIVWPFAGAPYVQIGARQVEVDPFPCYEHDRFLVNDHLQHVVNCLPLEMDVNIHTLAYDTPHRVNAFAELIPVDGAVPPGPRDGRIVMMGKRTPIHPAVTKYLVAHEYGHLVQRAIETRAGLKEHGFAPIYQNLRCMGEESRTYGGGTWHLDPGELFANDFRLLVCRSEVSFWPHLDVPRPETLPQIALFWEGVVREYKQHAKDRAAAASNGSTELALAS